MSLATSSLGPFATFSRAQWAALRAGTPLPLTEAELAALRGLGERIAIDEVEEIYLPLSRLLSLHVVAARALHDATTRFLGDDAGHVPYVIGLGGSVAVGKSTTARILATLLSRWPAHPRVELLTTDGFLYPNVTLKERGLMERKGFPESYDLARLLNVMAEIKAGSSRVSTPVYSHLEYDVLLDHEHMIEQPDILIVEGLNVLQAGPYPDDGQRVFVSDFFDFSIYVDADEPQLEKWYIDRFLDLRSRVFEDERSYFHRYANLDDHAAKAVATDIWNRINAVNLRENIAPTRGRAQLVLRKGADHRVDEVRLRRL